MGLNNTGPNLTPAPLTPALITPVSKIAFPPFTAGVKKAGKGKINIFKNRCFESYTHTEAAKYFCLC